MISGCDINMERPKFKPPLTPEQQAALDLLNLAGSYTSNELESFSGQPDPIEEVAPVNNSIIDLTQKFPSPKGFEPTYEAFISSRSNAVSGESGESVLNYSNQLTNENMTHAFRYGTNQSK